MRGGGRAAVAAGVAVLVAAALAPSGAAQASPARPMPIGVTAVQVAPAGVDQVRVTWSGGSRTTRYAFIAGSTSMTDRNHFETGWIAASDARIRARSVVLTVPAALRGVLGGGSGDYVFVKVVQTDSTGSPPRCRVWTPADLCRASPSGSYALAGTAAPAGATFPLSVASWNVQSVSATQDAAPDEQWAARLPRVVRNIESVAPDLVGTQESTTARLDPACLNPQGADTPQPCTEQYMSLAAGLAGTYSPVGADAWRWCYRQVARHAKQPAYRGYVDSALFFRPEVLALVDHGYISPVDDLRLSAFTSDDEAGVWAVLADRATGTRFLAASMHLPVGDANAGRRTQETTALAAWLVAKSARLGGVPVVLTADLNSYAGTDPTPAVLPLRAAGFSDAASAISRTNARMSTTNISNSVSEATGYPTVAVAHPYPTNRIDYVLTWTGPSASAVGYATSYENVVRLTADGTRFDQDYEGSDHDLQLAHLTLPRG